ncbi:MAG: hypothetical protein KatS3mg065_0237 [Chloroflexota bacterium]|nr:MAG: hypothetical protein KatS3mg065_0237 [Chloroflexota bacterium]
MPIKFPSFRPRRDAYPADLWTKCPSCSEMLFNRQLQKSFRVCPNCGHHFRMAAAERLALLLDPGSFEERDANLQSLDPLGFVDQKPYPDRLTAAQLATGLRDAAVWGFGRIQGERVAICVMDFGFMGGSMGSVVGEKVARAAEAALAERVPLVIVSASGGARMQEGTLALMQLAKTLAAIERLRAARIPYVSILTDPTTGGVYASFAAVGDVNLAEPNALIGFAGARVSAGTIAAELPAGFQRAEFLFRHGFVDRVVPRAALRDELALVLRYLRPAPAANEPGEGEPEATLGLPAFRPLSFISELADRVLADGRRDDEETAAPSGTASPNVSASPSGTASSTSSGHPQGNGNGPVLPPDQAAVWERVQLARNIRRPRTLELVTHLADEWLELHGDRLFGDDDAIVAGLARIDGRRVVVVGHQKGAETEENIRRNFGMPHPEGYRKAIRCFELAERFGLPVLTIVDTPGRLPRPGRRGARGRRSHRSGHRLHDPPPNPHRDRHRRRGRLGRRPRHRRRRRRPRPRERRLLRHQPRGLRLDPLANGRSGARSRRGDADDGRRAARPRGGRRRHRRAPGRCARRSRRNGPPPPAGHPRPVRRPRRPAGGGPRRATLPPLSSHGRLHRGGRRGRCPGPTGSRRADPQPPRGGSAIPRGTDAGPARPAGREPIGPRTQGRRCGPTRTRAPPRRGRSTRRGRRPPA